MNVILTYTHGTHTGVVSANMRPGVAISLDIVVARAGDAIERVEYRGLDVAHAIGELVELLGDDDLKVVSIDAPMIDALKKAVCHRHGCFVVEA